MIERKAEPPDQVVKSFKCVIVFKKRGGDPTMEDVHAALQRSGVTYGMPAQADGPIVISFNG